MILHDRALPEIAGSHGGFIALVVCLSVLVVGLCVGVYILLRDHEPTDQERAVRRQLSRRHREQGTDSSSPFTYNSSSENAPTFISKLGAMVGFGGVDKEGRKTKKGPRGGPGWVQAGSGDEWESDSDKGAAAQARSLSMARPHSQRDRDVSEAQGFKLADRSIPRNDGTVDQPFQAPRPRYSRTDSMTSEQEMYSPGSYDSHAPPSSFKHTKTAPTRIQTAGSISPSSPSSLDHTNSINRGITSSPEPYASGSTDNAHHPDGHHDSAQSGVSVRTSHTGTKFVESLE